MKNIEIYLHHLRRYYALTGRFRIGGCWFPLWRRRVKSIAKKSLSKNVILLDNGILIPVDSADKLTHRAWVRGMLAPDLEWAIHRYVKPGTISVDIGANLGFLSVLMADKVGQSGEVVVIEPNPDMQSKIEKIFQLNGFQNYRIFQCACSDKKGEFYFYIDEKDHSTSRISSDPTDLKVQLLPLDTILEGVDKPVSFIKIDVEGHEAEVMMGGQRTLRVHRPIMVFETGTHTSEQLRNINYILTEMSYEVVGVLQEWGIERKTLSLQMTNRSHCNVLAIPKHHL